MRYTVTVTGTNGIVAECRVDSMDNALLLRELFIGRDGVFLSREGVVEVTIRDDSEAQQDELAGWRA